MDISLDIDLNWDAALPPVPQGLAPESGLPSKAIPPCSNTTNWATEQAKPAGTKPVEGKAAKPLQKRVWSLPFVAPRIRPQNPALDVRKGVLRSENGLQQPNQQSGTGSQNASILVRNSNTSQDSLSKDCREAGHKAQEGETAGSEERPQVKRKLPSHWTAHSDSQAGSGWSNATEELPALHTKCTIWPPVKTVGKVPARLAPKPAAQNTMIEAEQPHRMPTGHPEGIQRRQGFSEAFQGTHQGASDQQHSLDHQLRDTQQTCQNSFAKHNTTGREPCFPEHESAADFGQVSSSHDLPARASDGGLLPANAAPGSPCKPTKPDGNPFISKRAVARKEQAHPVKKKRQKATGIEAAKLKECFQSFLKPTPNAQQNSHLTGVLLPADETAIDLTDDSPPKRQEGRNLNEFRSFASESYARPDSLSYLPRGDQAVDLEPELGEGNSPHPRAESCKDGTGSTGPWHSREARGQDLDAAELQHSNNNPGEEWWRRFPDFVPLNLLSNGVNPRTGAVVYIDYSKQFAVESEVATKSKSKRKTTSPKAKTKKKAAPKKRSSWAGNRKAAFFKRRK